MKHIVLAILLSGCVSISFAQTFRRPVSSAFVTDSGYSRSVNMIDTDSDGDLDVFVTNGPTNGQDNVLYKNENGRYVPVRNTLIAKDSSKSVGASWADYDNDGLLDACVVTWYNQKNYLYHNKGNNDFELLSNSPVVTDMGYSEDCAWGDYDNDGLIDLLVTNSSGADRKNKLYRNRGNGNFEAIDTTPVSFTTTRSRGVNWVDIDNDGDLDLYIANENRTANLAFRNDRNGVFTEMLNIPIVADRGSSMSASWGDLDNDGDLDVYVANAENQKNQLFLNNGNWNFTKIQNDTSVAENGEHFSTGWGDYDNDGDLDLYVTQAFGTGRLVNKLYKNRWMETGRVRFEKVTDVLPAQDSGWSYGFAWGDLDADGDLDLYIAKTYQNEPNACYLNAGNRNNWLEVRLKGTITNAAAIGSRIWVKAAVNSNSIWQVREVSSNTGYCGQNLHQHFGLGIAQTIDSLVVQWQSGHDTVLTNIAPGQVLTLTENPITTGASFKGNSTRVALRVFPNPSQDKNISIQFHLPKAEKGKILILDATGKQVAIVQEGNFATGAHQYAWIPAGISSGTFRVVLQFEQGTYSQPFVYNRP